MRLVLSVTLLSMLSLPILGLEKFPGVTRTTCNLNGMIASHPASYAFARVNGTSREKEYPEFGNVICQIMDKSGVEQAIAVLETVVFGDSPQMISLQVADVFAPDVEGKTISCQYRDISHREDGTMTGTGTFICDALSDLKIVITGMGMSIPPDLDSELENSKRERRSLEPESEISKIQCSSGTESANSEFTAFPNILGQVCTIENDEYRYRVGRVYLINSTGGLDCLPCCVNHHWNNITKQCEACRKGYVQPLPNFWLNCEPLRSPKKMKPTSSSTTSTIRLTQPSQAPPTESIMPDTPATNPKQIFRIPNLAPSNVRTIKVGFDYAKIGWDGVSNDETQSVTKYKVMVSSVTKNESGWIEQESGNTETFVIDLKPGMTYQVLIMAGNSIGFGPPSKTLIFTTLRRLEPPRDVQHVLAGNKLTITWNPRSWEEDFGAVVSIKCTPDKFWKGEQENLLKHEGMNEVTIELHDFGIYDVKLYYSNDEEKKGPEFPFKVQYQDGGKTALKIGIWSFAAIGVPFLAIMAMALVFDLLRDCLRFFQQLCATDSAISKV